MVYHIPALLHETIDGLNIRKDGTYVDVTFGGGGHSREILSHLGENGRLFSFDQDMDAYENARKFIPEGGHCIIEDTRWQFVHSNFRYLRNFLHYYDISEIDGLLADLGVSFHHFDEAERGFSFRYCGPLDMRMNRQARRTAADIINTYSEEDLARIFYLYGEVRDAKRIARNIIKARNTQEITTTQALVSSLLSPNQWSEKEGEMEIDSAHKKDLARIFQALRMEVNDELGALREMLVSAKDILRPGGRIAILTYHSLEDRLVKNFFRSGNLEGEIEKDFYGNILTPFRIIEKGLTASEEEVAENPRARSAKLRVVERI